MKKQRFVIPDGFVQDYPHMLNIELADKYNMTLNQIKFYALKTGVKKTPEVLRLRAQMGGTRSSSNSDAKIWNDNETGFTRIATGHRIKRIGNRIVHRMG